MKDKWLGHTVKIIGEDIWKGQRGKVVAKVRVNRYKDYIIQFKKDWSFFRSKELKLTK